MRAFLGFELPRATRLLLLNRNCEVPGARWQTTEQLHLTLRFLDELDQRRVEEVCEALAPLRAGAIRLRICGAGAFGAPPGPCVLWVGLDPVEPLLALRRQVDALLEPLALQSDRHDRYRPHVTLARLPGLACDLDECLSRLAEPIVGDFELSELCLFSSTPSAQGSCYRVEHRWML